MTYRKLTSDEQTKIRESLYNIIDADEKTIIDALWDFNPHLESINSSQYFKRKITYHKPRYRLTAKSFKGLSDKILEYFILDEN
jgi:hypothetical protein